uniref:Kinesin heavy chain (Trinotate prediction) n=1 Tax=Henneguya salminicola TaxID=69463 RepID=A0A6G3MM37_HENSL
MQKHQILMQTNVQLSQEIPKLQVYCKNSQERVKYLEKILFDTKIQTERETVRLKSELDQLLQANAQNKELKKKVPQIAKPIKPTDRHKLDKTSVLHDLSTPEISQHS